MKKERVRKEYCTSLKLVQKFFSFFLLIFYEEECIQFSLYVALTYRKYCIKMIYLFFYLIFWQSNKTIYIYDSTIAWLVGQVNKLGQEERHSSELNTLILSKKNHYHEKEKVRVRVSVRILQGIWGREIFTLIHKARKLKTSQKGSICLIALSFSHICIAAHSTAKETCFLCPTKIIT